MGPNSDSPLISNPRITFSKFQRSPGVSSKIFYEILKILKILKVIQKLIRFEKKYHQRDREANPYLRYTKAFPKGRGYMGPTPARDPNPFRTVQVHGLGSSVDFPRCDFFLTFTTWKRCEMAIVFSVIFAGTRKYLQSFRMSAQ